MGEREWYFFSLRDRKYPTGLRTNRATGAGYWKATGKDREVYGGSGSGALLIGMKKTLVFYKGRAPRGHKTRWVMHEYRLHGHFSYYRHHHACKEEWVICRIFHKEEKAGPRGGEQMSYIIEQQQPFLLEEAPLLSVSSSSSSSSCTRKFIETPAPGVRLSGGSQLHQNTFPQTIIPPPAPIGTFNKPSFSPTMSNQGTSSSSTPLASTHPLKCLFSHQDCTFLKQEITPTVGANHHHHGSILEEPHGTSLIINNDNEMKQNHVYNQYLSAGSFVGETVGPSSSYSSIAVAVAAGFHHAMTMTENTLHPIAAVPSAEPSWLV